MFVDTIRLNKEMREQLKRTGEYLNARGYYYTYDREKCEVRKYHGKGGQCMIVRYIEL